MAKKIQAIVKLQIEGGAATAAPPVGPALGQHGANIMAFVKEYNEKTASMKGDVIPVEITIFQDKSFTFELKSPPAAALILKAAKIQKGASESGVQVVGKMQGLQSMAHLQDLLTIYLVLLHQSQDLTQTATL